MIIGVCGTGRAGKEMIKKVLKSDRHELGMVINRSSSKTIGVDAGSLIDGSFLDKPVIALPNALENAKKNNVDVIIDFSGKDTSIELLREFSGQKINFVICTTNFDNDLWEQFKAAASEIKGAIVYASTLTVGINLLIDFASKLSRILPDFEFEIVERHSSDKPKPTTTARRISDAIGRGGTNISSVRVGGYVGLHEVTAANESERLTIIHESFSRQAFAYGAMLAAEFAQEKTGFFEMKDVIEELKKENAL